MKEELQPAIAALQKDLGEHEKKVIDIKTMINKLSELAELPAPHPNVDEATQASIASIQGDTFYGKSVNTAARMYLEMRKSARLGPASPRDVYGALKKGGFVFNSKSESNSITVVRNALSKQSSIFHRLPTGDYGLLKWYDKVKRLKGSAGDNNDEDDSEVESADPKKESADE